MPLGVLVSALPLSPREVLQNVFGFNDFRGQQEAVIATVLRGESALLLMPTGMGKSVCYQIPARVLPGLTLVISPLIALMKDQVDAAEKRGFRTCFINSSLTSGERDQRYRRLAAGEFELVYVTPERFRKPEFIDALLKNQISLFAVDEAHCISTWGHDFRPDYSRLGDYRKLLGNPVTLALTATATPDVQKDILKQLDLVNIPIFNEGLKRPGLAVSVLDVHGLDEKTRAAIMFRHQYPGPAIIYFSLIQTLRKFSEQLSRLGLSHLIYHGQLHDRDRRRSQEIFKTSMDALMLATPAFGLGVDKENVRLLLHAEIPGSLEAYYQEIGRAGRDQQSAECVLLYDADDVSIQMDFMKWANPDPGFIQSVYNLIERNLARARAEGLDYLREQMNFYNSRDFRIETAVNLLERWGSLEGQRSSREWQPVQSPPLEYLDRKLYEAQMRMQRHKLLEMVSFAKGERVLGLDRESEKINCRMQDIQRYFGFLDEEPCGICDLCRLSKSGAL